MRTVRWLLYRDILASVMFVTLAFLSLFYFFDFVADLDKIGRGAFTVWTAALLALLAAPSNLYELLPITVLIGTIYSLARLAQSSEFTVLRTSGLGPMRALALLAMLGAAFTLTTFAIGDYLAPWAARRAVLVEARATGALALAKGGAWLKDRRLTPEGERSWSINVAGADASGALQGIRIFEFDGNGRMLSRTSASSGRVGDSGEWLLQEAEVTTWPQGHAEVRAGAKSRVDRRMVAQMSWASTLSSEVVAAAVLPLSTMTTLELLRYSAHLSGQEQATQRYQLQFWKKAVYPLACVVMVALALPFAYLQARAGGVSLKVFGGIMLGISFILLNNVAGHIGQLKGLTPWVVSAAPSAFYLLISMAAFSWLVRYR